MTQQKRRRNAVFPCEETQNVNRFPIFCRKMPESKKILCYDTPFLQKTLEIVRKMWYDNIEQIPCWFLLSVNMETNGNDTEKGITL